jgi:hypothetical protein
VVTNLARQHLVLFQQQVHRLATGTSIGLKYTGILLCSVSDLDPGSGVPGSRMGKKSRSRFGI